MKSSMKESIIDEHFFLKETHLITFKHGTNVRCISLLLGKVDRKCYEIARWY